MHYPRESALWQEGPPERTAFCYGSAAYFINKGCTVHQLSRKAAASAATHQGGLHRAEEADHFMVVLPTLGHGRVRDRVTNHLGTAAFKLQGALRSPHTE